MAAALQPFPDPQEEIGEERVRQAAKILEISVEWEGIQEIKHILWGE